jgi:hypothetical protein
VLSEGAPEEVERVFGVVMTALAFAGDRRIGYLHQPRSEKLSDHSALSIRLNVAPPQALPVSDPVTAMELPTLF